MSRTKSKTMLVKLPVRSSSLPTRSWTRTQSENSRAPWPFVTNLARVALRTKPSRAPRDSKPSRAPCEAKPSRSPCKAKPSRTLFGSKHDLPNLGLRKHLRRSHSLASSHRPQMQSKQQPQSSSTHMILRRLPSENWMDSSPTWVSHSKFYLPYGRDS